MADRRELPRHRAFVVARYLVGIAAGLLVLLLVVGHRSELRSVWRLVGRVDALDVVGAAGAEALSYLCFSLLQRRTLALGGASIPLGFCYLLSLANDAIANSLPGEPAVSSAYRYRHYRRHGATSAGAGWTIFTMLIAQAIAMASIVLVGVLVSLGSATTGARAAVGVLGVVLAGGAVAVLVRRSVVIGLAERAVRAARRLTGRPTGPIGERVEAALRRMREIPLSARATVTVVSLAAGAWLADFGCLLFGFAAVHAGIPWRGVLLAYGVAQVVGVIPFVPGGIGIVEGSLAVVLAAYGATKAGALAAALVYRGISFWASIAIGWVTVAGIEWVTRRARPLRAESPPVPAGADRTPAEP